MSKTYFRTFLLLSILYFICKTHALHPDSKFVNKFSDHVIVGMIATIPIFPFLFGIRVWDYTWKWMYKITFSLIMAAVGVYAALRFNNESYYYEPFSDYLDDVKYAFDWHPKPLNFSLEYLIFFWVWLVIFIKGIAVWYLSEIRRIDDKEV